MLTSKQSSAPVPDLSNSFSSASGYRLWWSMALMWPSRTSRGSVLRRAPNGRDTPPALATWSSWKPACLWPHKLLNSPNNSMSKLQCFCYKCRSCTVFFFCTFSVFILTFTNILVLLLLKHFAAKIINNIFTISSPVVALLRPLSS